MEAGQYILIKTLRGIRESIEEWTPDNITEVKAKTTALAQLDLLIIMCKGGC